MARDRRKLARSCIRRVRTPSMSPFRFGILGGFLRQRGRVRGTASDPCPKGRVGSVAGGSHQEPARGGSAAAAQVERLRAGLTKQGVRLRWIHPDDEVFSVNPDRHVAAEEEGDAAEHLLLDEARSTRELLSYAFGLCLRIRHRFPRGPLSY